MPSLASFMIHAEIWLTDSPVFLHTDESQAASTTISEEQEDALRGVQPFLIPREFFVVVGAGERRPGSHDWKAGRGNERVRGCRARVLWESFSAF